MYKMTPRCLTIVKWKTIFFFSLEKIEIHFQNYLLIFFPPHIIAYKCPFKRNYYQKTQSKPSDAHPWLIGCSIVEKPLVAYVDDAVKLALVFL